MTNLSDGVFVVTIYFYD